MSSELEAAVERLKDIPGMIVPQGGVLDALMTLTNEYMRLADPTPASVEWISKLNSPDTMRFCCVQLIGNDVFLSVNEVCGKEPVTKGAVRMLAKSLGIELAE